MVVVAKAAAAYRRQVLVLWQQLFTQLQLALHENEAIFAMQFEEF